MKKSIAIMAGTLMLSTLPSVSVADIDQIEAQKQSRMNQRTLIETQCQDRNGQARQFSTLLGGPGNYGGPFPQMGRLAGELEYVPPLKGPVLSSALDIIKKSAERRLQMLKARQLSRDVYRGERDSYTNSDWKGFASDEMSKAEARFRQSVQYISNKAVSDVEELLGESTVFVKRPYRSNNSQVDKAQNNYDKRRLTHIEKNAGIVMAECRAYWQSGFEAVKGKELLYSVQDRRRREQNRF